MSEIEQSVGLTKSDETRGRKATSDTDYCRQTQVRIDEFKEKLRNNKSAPESEKKKWRNQVSSLQNRIK